MPAKKKGTIRDRYFKRLERRGHIYRVTQPSDETKSLGRRKIAEIRERMGW